MRETKNTIRSLDGLRGLAALSVFTTHWLNTSHALESSFSTELGQVGVMLFFILSGFLMGYLYLGDAATPPAIGRFLVRRLARVAPLFVFVVIASFLVLQAVPSGPLWAYPIATVDKLFQHFALIKGADVMWSVVVEIRFYLLVPVIWIAYRYLPRLTLASIAALVIAFFSYKAATSWAPIRGWQFLSFLPYFLTGMFIARIGAGKPSAAWNYIFAGALPAGLVLYPLAQASGVLPAIERWSNPLSLLAVATILVATLRAPLADRLLGAPVFRFLGQISYGIYLLHPIVLVNVDHFSRLDHKPLLFLLVTLPITICLASLSYMLIERPARRAINGWIDKRTMVPASPTGSPTGTPTGATRLDGVPRSSGNQGIS